MPTERPSIWLLNGTKPMSSRALRLTVDTQAAKPTELIGTVARMGVPVVLTSRMFLDLCGELGDYEAATSWLIDLATATGKPAAVNLPDGPENTVTVLLAPRGWTDEKLRGWGAGMREELAAMFGPATISAWGND